MKAMETWILSYLLNSLWQVPLLFAGGWLATRLLRSAGSLVEHRVWVLVLVLQSFLPACFLASWSWLQRFAFWGSHANQSGDGQVSIVMGSGAGLAAIEMPGGLLTAVGIAYLIATTYFGARFLWRSYLLAAMRREAVPAAKSIDLVECCSRYAHLFATHNVAIAACSRVTGPVALGIRRKLILFPKGMVETLVPEDLNTVLAHEFAHLHRHDFLKNLLYEVLSLPVAYHPLFWFTRARIMETREMLCDQMAADINGPHTYARSLLRLTRLFIEGTYTATPHAIGIFDANTFERRIMKLSDHKKEVRGLRRAALVAASGLMGLAISGSAIAMAMHVTTAATTESSQAKQTKRLSVSAAVMAGNLVSKAMPVYPPDAKKAKIQGKVVVSAVIDTQGNIQNLRVVSGPRELQQSALDAVRQWKYRPYLLNGDAVEVSTSINIIYSLKG
jgi:TonB family protein